MFRWKCRDLHKLVVVVMIPVDAVFSALVIYNAANYPEIVPPLQHLKTVSLSIAMARGIGITRHASRTNKLVKPKLVSLRFELVKCKALEHLFLFFPPHPLFLS